MNMDFQYSPHRSAGGTMHLLSPSHSQLGEIFPTVATIKQIRRSLSRSPSKAPRFQIHTANRSSPRHLSNHSSISPSDTVRPANAQTQQQTAPKFNVRRTAPIKNLFRRQSSNDSVKTTVSADSSTSQAQMPIDTINDMDTDPQQESVSYTPKQVAAGMRFELDSEPIKFDLLKAHAEKSTYCDTFKENASMAKSSPLKRSDGVMNLDQPNMESPRAKRRSLALSSDFDVFDQTCESSLLRASSSSRRRNSTNTAPPPAATPLQPRSPQRRPVSLRRSTLQQRAGVSTVKPRTSPEQNDMPASPAAPLRPPAMPRTRSRMTLDSILPVRSLENTSIPSVLKAHAPSQPHPLSKALSPSSSTSSLAEESGAPAPLPTFTSRPITRANPAFSKSLPIGALRPRLSRGADDGTDSFETPGGAYRSAKPLPAAFMSTGLISKRNRNADVQPGSFGSSLNMPDTPSKKTSMAIDAATPTHRAHLGSRFAPPRHEFGSPTTPFSPQAFKNAPESFGKGVGIFGSKVGPGRLVRRSSFLSIEGEDATDSPAPQVSGVDELPPTPTRATTHVVPRPMVKVKANSLRSSVLGRRTGISSDLFVPPERAERMDCEPPALTPHHTGEDGTATAPPFITFTPSGSNTSPSLGRSRNQRLPVRERSPSPLPARSGMALSISTCNDEGSEPSVQTPIEPSFDMETSAMTVDSFTPPDASRLSISGDHSFRSSMRSLPPATPTGPRDHPFGLSTSLAASSSGYFENDIDTNLTSRFGSVQLTGTGEFSLVYRVADPLANGLSSRLRTPRSVGRVWAVKKSKKPFAGSKDRARKRMEGEILNALRGCEHIIESIEMWEMKSHLYIQTEYCENGNLKEFLTRTGNKGRLDDFRIWKILLEVSQGLHSIHAAGYIHLDIKPANIFIDWEGVLKIGDFGMASAWPAPPHFDGEGDREYIAPEILGGHFDKPADVFAMGMIMLEIAGNCVLPDNGMSWQRLRAGDMSDLPSLTFSTESSLPRDASGDPIYPGRKSVEHGVALVDDDDDDELDLSFGEIKTPTADTSSRPHELVQGPMFMVDPENDGALSKLVQRLISPSPEERPDVDQLLGSAGLQWVAERRRAGATVYEGVWGPADDVLGSLGDIEMTDS